MKVRKLKLLFILLTAVFIQCKGGAGSNKGQRERESQGPALTLKDSISERDDRIDDSVNLVLEPRYSDTVAHKNDETKRLGEEGAVTQSKSKIADGSLADKPKVYIDNEGFTVKRGKRFFPFGVYILSSNDAKDENLKQISEAGFNTVLCYGFGSNSSYDAYLKKAHQYGMNVIFSLKSMYPKSSKDEMDYYTRIAGNWVDRVKDYEAILAWYINDEMGTPRIPQIKKMYDEVRERDSNHIIFQVLYQPEILSRYNDITDALALVAYNVPADDLTRSSRNLKLTKAAMGGKKGVWQVPQIYDKVVYNEERAPRPPTTDEMRNQAYQAIIQGAKGLIFYSYSDIFKEKNPKTRKIDREYHDSRWQDVTTMGNEIRKILPAILEGTESQSIDVVGSNSGIEFRVLEYNGELLVLLANPFYKSKTIVLSFPSQYYQPLQGSQGNITGNLKGNQITLTLQPIQSGVYKFVKRQ